MIANGSLCIGLERLGNVLGDILEMLPEEFNMAEIMQNNTARSPCTLVCLQECERMNLPLSDI